MLDRAAIPRAHVAGVSLGGMVAQEFAIRHPLRVDRLVLAATTPGWPFAYPMPSQSAGLLLETRRLIPPEALRRHVENALAARTVRERPELVERIVGHQARRPPNGAAWTALANAGASFAGNLRQHRITAPTLVLHGDDDTVVDPRNAKLLARRVPGAVLVSWPAHGHLMFWEDPDRFVAEVTAFLLKRDG